MFNIVLDITKKGEGKEYLRILTFASFNIENYKRLPFGSPFIYYLDCFDTILIGYPRMPSSSSIVFLNRIPNSLKTVCYIITASSTDRGNFKIPRLKNNSRYNNISVF